MYKIKELVLISLLVIFTGCGGSGDNTTSSSTSSSLVDAEPIKKAVIQVDKLTIDVQKETFDTTTKLLGDVSRMMGSFDKMNGQIIDTIDLSMKLANTLAQPVGITDNYKTFFAIASDYNSTSPAFNVAGLTKNYFLLSSVTPFFLEKKTVKSYFTNSSSLADAWVKALAVADKSKNLYFSIVEIDTENVTHKVSNALLIKSADLQNL